jgi:light-regulated signal transduction histidine kinase (bacteriophytochrome)
MDEGWRVRADGSRYWSNLVLTAVHDESGTLCGFSKISRDVTERRRAQETIERLNEELEQRVRERTAQLEAANHELEAFSYSVSHDLRAPLRHIAAYVEILESECGERLEPGARRHLQTIAGSARQLSHLIDALLAFSRMGRAEMRLQPVQLAELVEEARRQVRDESQGRLIDWRIGELPLVHGDALMLRQAILNLLSNSVKYTRSRERARIEIGAEVTPLETVFYVRDNGVGFDMAYAGKLFGVFQRLHRPSEFEGTGIGLANVRRIIQRHGGRTWAEGALQVGATFYFSIPHPARGIP